MSRRLMIISLASVAVLIFAADMLAQQEKMDKDKACAILGNCSDEMVQQAKATLEECNKTMAKAEELMEKGKTIRGQGLLWGDKEMENDGLSIYNQGKKMYEDAKALSNTCSTIITEAEKLKKKYKKAAPEQAAPTPEKRTPIPGL